MRQGRNFRRRQMFMQTVAPAVIPPPMENPVRGNAGQRDPRGAGQAYAPIYPSDLLSGFDTQNLLHTGIRRQIAPGQQAQVADAGNGYAPAAPASQPGPQQTVETQWPASILAVGVGNAIQMVPKNLSRRSIKVANVSQGIIGGNITISFNAPSSLSGVGLGIQIAAGATYEPQNDTVSVDTVWVWSDDGTAEYPIPVIAFEGVTVSS